MTALLSSPNLIANAGFFVVSAGSPKGWDAPAGARLIDLPDCPKTGFPRALRAIELPGTPEPLRQSVDLSHERVRPPVPGQTTRFAVRLAARAGADEAIGRVTISADGVKLAAQRIAAAPDWSPHRFALAADAAPTTLEIAIEATAPLQLTDFRLVALYDPPAGLEPFPIRFLARGPYLLPSSRLRAYHVADYLDLIGWPTAFGPASCFTWPADLVVCQKVRRWDAWTHARIAGAAILYDLDDNETVHSRRRAHDIRLFSRAVDGVTAGSTFLAEMMAAWNDRVFLFDNMVDILDRDILHHGGLWQDRLVWFGMPENAWALDAIDLDRPVRRITRGGDVEYGLKTIDRDLAACDLALLPMPLDDATRAKNANRLVKCAGLGLPVLADDTPENRRAAERLGIADTVLVKPGENWQTRIDHAAADYAALCQTMADARQRTFAVYGVEPIVADWLHFCAGLVRAKRGRRSNRQSIR